MRLIVPNGSDTVLTAGDA